MSGLDSRLDVRFLAATSTSFVAGGASHEALLGGRRGAGHESSRSHSSRGGQEDHLDTGRRDIRGDAARGKTSPRRVPSAVLEEVLRLYRERYFDLNVRHFHEKLTAEHGLTVSYNWTKGV